MRYIFFSFSLKKSFFNKKKKINIKFFFHIKLFFSANNAYFVKKTNIFSKINIFFFQLSFAANEQPYSRARCQKQPFASFLLK